ncbi:MAG: cupin domain-containing protein [Gammaproteobacteria bacterium]
MATVRNLFANRPHIEYGEHFEQWLRCKNVVIERIVSSDTPDPRCYDQVQDEWVVLLQGTACLEIDNRTVTLHAGDAIFIPAHTPHRVVKTSKEPQCVWLAVHIY